VAPVVVLPFAQQPPPEADHALPAPGVIETACGIAVGPHDTSSSGEAVKLSVVGDISEEHCPNSTAHESRRARINLFILNHKVVGDDPQYK
jgi:hypothetical protein